MPGISQRVMRICERATRWRPRGRLAARAVIARRRPSWCRGPRGARRHGIRRGPGPAVGLVDRLQRRLQRRVGIRHRLPVDVRHRGRLQLRHRRDRDDDQLDQQRPPRRQRQPRHHRARQRQLVDLRPRPDHQRQRGRARGRRAGGHRLDRAALRRPRLLAGVLDARPGPVAGERRDRHHGGRQLAVGAVRDRALRCRPGRPVQRAGRHRQRTRGVLGLPVRLPHLHDDPQPDEHLGRVDHVLPGRQLVLHRDRGPGGHVDVAGGVRP